MSEKKPKSSSRVGASSSNSKFDSKTLDEALRRAGGASIRRRKGRTLARRLQVARRYLQGMKPVEIAEQLGRATRTIERDITWIRQEWRNAAVLDANQSIGEELARLGELERAAWFGWERSIGDAEAKRVVERGETGVVATKRSKSTFEKSVTRNRGRADGRFLDVILRIVERRCRLLGLDAPQEVNVRRPEIIAVTIDEHVEAIEFERWRELTVNARRPRTVETIDSIGDSPATADDEPERRETNEGNEA